MWRVSRHMPSQSSRTSSAFVWLMMNSRHSSAGAGRLAAACHGTVAHSVMKKMSD